MAFIHISILSGQQIMNDSGENNRVNLEEFQNARMVLLNEEKISTQGFGVSQAIFSV